MTDDAIDIFELSDPATRSSACARIAASLPEWFGRPDANAFYAREIAAKTTFAARAAGEIVGLVALQPHFEASVEIWWLGVRRDWRGRGVGKRLIARAAAQARAICRTRLVLATLSPRSADPRYAETRAFYERVGFEPLIEVDGPDAATPMMWMIRRL